MYTEPQDKGKTCLLPAKVDFNLRPHTAVFVKE